MTTVYPFHDKDLSQLAPPEALEILDYETLLRTRKDALNGLQPLLLDTQGRAVHKAATLINTDTESYWKVPFNAEAGLYYVDLESDPAARILEADTYRELLLRQHINETAKSLLIAYATGSNLEHLAANYGLTRLTIAESDNEAAVVLESDTALRKRLLLAIEGYARGGSVGWYVFNALSASGLVKDVSVVSPEPCEIIVTILSHEGQGVASERLLQTVRDHLNSRHSRVLGDKVTVQSAEIVPYAVAAQVQLYTGPSASVVFMAIESALSTYRQQSETIGHGIYASALDAVLQQAGVYKAVVTSPPALPLNISAYQAPYCTGLTLTEVFD